MHEMPIPQTEDSRYRCPARSWLLDELCLLCMFDSRPCAKVRVWLRLLLV